MRLTSDGSASPDGKAIILSDLDRDGPLLWEIGSARYRPAPTISQDVSWADSGSGVISATGSDRVGPNWLAYTSALAASGGGYGSQLVDPEGINLSPNRHYARPVVSPLGNRTAYFVTDDTSGLVELHVAVAQQPPRVVARWQKPPDALLAPPLLAFWPSDDTLVYVLPDDWTDGLPGSAHLLRPTIAPEGVFTTTTLRTIHTRGNERGVVMRELALSPDGRQLAYRLRHYDQRTADSGRHDTLQVSNVDDVSHAFELARDLPGDGLVWSPDSRWLAAGLHGRIALLAADGQEQRFVTDEGMHANFPVWLANGQIWFAVDATDGPHIWQVTVR
jgi:hypothetical protein